jgi:hypothetical protein
MLLATYDIDFQRIPQTIGASTQHERDISYEETTRSAGYAGENYRPG